MSKTKTTPKKDETKTKRVSVCSLFRERSLKGVKNRMELAEWIVSELKKNGVEKSVQQVMGQISAITVQIKKKVQPQWTKFKLQENKQRFLIMAL